MNPNTPQPNFELPVPLPPNGNGEQGGPMHEVAPGQLEHSQQTAPPMAQPLSPQLPPAGSSPIDPSTGAPLQSSPSTPAVADDTDLIEKEWVEKAKQIVAATRENPYEQNKQMSRVKADYLKKRYNKDIKVEES